MRWDLINKKDRLRKISEKTALIKAREKKQILLIYKKLNPKQKEAVVKQFNEKWG